jgi:F0F1-type ATP synthase assembly protein I
MPPEDQSANSEVEAAQASFTLAFKVIAQVGILTLLVIIGAVFGGVILDRSLGTRPLFTVLLLLVTFPVLLYIIYRVALRAVADIHRAARAQAKTPGVKEERNRVREPDHDPHDNSTA